MGGSGQPKNTTTTTITQIPDWLKNDYQSFINQTNAINQLPYQSYGGQLNAAPTWQQNQATGIAGLGAQGGLGMQQAQGAALQGVLNGQFNVNPSSNPWMGAQTQVGSNPYMGQNPQLQSMINQANTNLTNAHNTSVAPQLAAQFAQGGAFGGSAYNQQVQNAQNTLAQNIGNTDSNLLFQNYNQSAQLAQQQIQNSINAQQTDLARNAALYQQGVQNQFTAANQNAQNILGASQAITGANALQSQFLGQYANLAGLQQDYNQGNLNQAYNDWYMKNYGYAQQQLNNYGNALNAISGNFSGSATTGLNPAYQPKSAGGALASAGGGALSGAAAGAMWGSAGGPIGAGGGALIGGGLGLLGYYI